MCKISKKRSGIPKRLLINCDSMSVPIIPVIATYFNEILVCDNRKSKSYCEEIVNFNPTHYLCMLTVNNFYLKKYITNVL